MIQCHYINVQPSHADNSNICLLIKKLQSPYRLLKKTLNLYNFYFDT